MSADNKNKNLRLILAINAQGLPEEMSKSQFFPMPHDQTLETLENAGLWFGPRPVLEETESFRQIIPYIVLKYGSKYILYTRTPAGGEARLHGRTSLGVGGHIDLEDADVSGTHINLDNTLINATGREVLEELGYFAVIHQRWLGLLVDHDTPVGRVHIGVVGLWTIVDMPACAAEDAIGDVSLKSIEELQAGVESMESWTAMLLPWLSENT